MTSTYDPLVGSVLDGRYEVLAKLARGGMATVYRARDLRLTRIVALKVMRSDLGEDDEFAAKFDREARAAATLNHPAVVGVFDQGSSEGRPYIVMEYVEGETLRRIIAREAPLAPEHALELLEPIISALAAAHEAGVVHRDIKPENVLVSTRGQVKVADFGLARLMSAPQMTATGVLVGTASYLPPELVTHSRPTARSDIYSAGIVAYELLTGRKPHTGDNNYQIAYRHVNVDVPAPSQALSQAGFGWRIPDYVDAFVAAATARDPRHRISDGTGMIRVLREVRQRLLRDPQRNDPALAARIAPETHHTTSVRPLTPAPQQRPRPMSTAAPPPGSSSTTAVVDAPPQWPHIPPAGPGSPVSPPVQRLASPPREPIPPHGEDSGRQPRMPRTPVLGRVKLSHNPVHKRRRGVVAVIAILLLTIAIGFGSWWWAAGRFTTVPALTQVSADEATRMAADSGLRTTTVTAHSEEVSEGLVISTDPVASTKVPREAEVELTVSLGPERFDMPSVVGLTTEEATAELTKQNLVVGEVSEQWSEDVAAGVVLSASQEAGAQLKRGTTIDLAVSKGKEPIEITDHVGAKASDAIASLESAGFKVSESKENSATVPAGIVISQSPGSGSAHRGETVEIVTSLGPVMVTVPDVQYDSIEAATKELESLGLKVETRSVQSFPQPLQIASGTEPAAGTSVAEGSTVVILVS
ncbi:MAG: Stk1 family PASTA domain-containing Ser/Thr kinase [Arachnia sp.]